MPTFSFFQTTGILDYPCPFVYIHLSDRNHWLTAEQLGRDASVVVMTSAAVDSLKTSSPKQEAVKFTSNGNTTAKYFIPHFSCRFGSAKHILNQAINQISQTAKIQTSSSFLLANKNIQLKPNRTPDLKDLMWMPNKSQKPSTFYDCQSKYCFLA